MKTVFCIALVMSIGLAAGVTNAQDPDPMPPVQLSDDLVLIKSLIKEKQEKLEAALEPHINEMKTVCDLSDAQVKKLKVASKGAAIKAISQRKKQVNQMMADHGGGENEGAFLIQFKRDLEFDLLFGDSFKAEDTKTWKLILKKTLTDEQQKKYEAVLAERLKFQRTAAVKSFVTRVDSRLLLSADQRKRLTEFIDKEYGEELTVFNAEQGEIGGIIFFGESPVGKKPLEKNSPLRKILSEKQQTIWVRDVAKHLESIRSTLAENSFFARFQIIGAPEMELAPLEAE